MEQISVCCLADESGLLSCLLLMSMSKYFMILEWYQPTNHCDSWAKLDYFKNHKYTNNGITVVVTMVKSAQNAITLESNHVQKTELKIYGVDQKL